MKDALRPTGHIAAQVAREIISPDVPLHEKPSRIKQTLHDGYRGPFIEFCVRKIPRAIDKLVPPIKYDYGVNEQIKQDVEDGRLIIYYSDHQGPFDALITGAIAGHYDEVIHKDGANPDKHTRVHLPGAVTLASGEQGKLMQRLHAGVQEDLFNRFGVVIFDITRDKDATDERRSSRRELVDRYSSIIAAGDAIFPYPERGQDGGRKKVPDGDRDDIKGLQEIKEGTLWFFVSLAAKHGKKVSFVPVGIDGSYNIIDPNYKKTSKSDNAQESFSKPKQEDEDKARPTLHAILAVSTPIPAPKVSVRVGTPIHAEDLSDIVTFFGKEDNVKNKEDYLMTEVAWRIPRPEKRGPYANLYTLDSILDAEKEIA